MLHKLKNNSTIGIVAPAFKSFTEPDLDLLTKILKDEGYQVLFGESIYAKEGYLAGSDELRCRDLMAMYQNESVDAILCLKGGYGTMRILDMIDYDIIKKNPKALIGYSDITALQNAIYAKTKIPSIHGLVGISLLNKSIDDKSKNYFFDLLKGKENLNIIDTVDAEGILVGGNLSLVSSLIGTPYLDDFKGKILMLEDVDEEPYSIDRMLSQLKHSGVFEQISGLILGHFTDCNPSKSRIDCQTVDEIIDEYIKDLKIPIIRHYPFGHSFPFLSLPIGVYVYMNVDKNSIWWDEKLMFK